jgi:formylglycine-generating enzyme required for sulfatase activity
MRTLFLALTVCVVSAFCLSSVWAADLKTFKEVYQKNSDETLQSYQPKFASLQQQYQKSLEALKALAVKQGELLKIKAAKAEIERFQQAKSMPPEPEAATLPEIRALQSAYMKQYNGLEQELTAFAATALAPAGGKPGAKKDLYLVVDLSRGPKADKFPVATLADVPKGGWTDEYKTDQLVLRKIEPGTFTMGSPEGELGRKGDETQHEVTLTKGFYIGVFEVTQKQWERVMGDWPSHFNNPKCREARPVERVSYDDIRGSVNGAGWPATNSVDAASFIGRLRARSGQAFDLPTEAQWEYACRAGTASALNSGLDLTSTNSCPNLAAVARYKGNAGDTVQNCDTGAGTSKVGSYLPNAWGVYDLHGNVREWCLDSHGKYTGAESDPKGMSAGSSRVLRGGSWSIISSNCRSAYRNSGTPDNVSGTLGFRAALSPGQP